MNASGQEADVRSGERRAAQALACGTRINDLTD
jgi:hypothetical protein